MPTCLTSCARLLIVVGAVPGAVPAPDLTRAQQAPSSPPSELRDSIERFSGDRAALLRRYSVGFSPAQRRRLREFYTDWSRRLDRVPATAFGIEGRVDQVLLANEVRYQLALLDREERQFQEMTPWVPFAGTVMDLEEARRRMESVDPRRTAEALWALARQVDSARQRAMTALPGDSAARGEGRLTRVIGRRVMQMLDDLDRTLERWHGFHAGYDPLFTWWTADPYARADSALARYARFLRETVVGARPGQAEPMIGDPIGVEGLRADLAHEMIPYTLEELIAIAEREFAWCEAELRKASREMGFGDDWKAALEKVKQTFVPPGEQPTLVRDLAREAMAFVEEKNLVTVPPLAKEIWRMEMIPPARQRVSLFFLGGEVFQVSYPTDEMTHDEKLMSMRGNNPHFSRATAHHEMIPGHHLQGFMTSRYNTHRRLFATLFWGEGWALYWEMLLWDLGFPRGPEDRMGMLFWRSHRAPRIICSLRFHQGTMSPQQAVDSLGERVGHERANAEGEVRPSIAGDCSPLHQAAYMPGGLQFRAL